jgi:perosamine synthetase
MADFCRQVVTALREVLGAEEKFVPLHEPHFAGNEWSYVKECLDTRWVSSAGKYVDEFEHRLANFAGTEHAVATVNGTAALHVCLLLAGVQPGDEVIVPTLTFVATANAVSYCSAIPHFVDCEEQTLGLNPRKLGAHLEKIAQRREAKTFNQQTGRRIAAIVPMHTFGHPVDLDPLLEIANQFEIPLIEDAAESLGSSYKGKHTGGFGRLSALSFNGNKIMTTGGGGAVLTDDPQLAKLAKHLTTTARLPHAWDFTHDQVGFNYRMPNLNAALGCAQLEQVPGFVDRKRALAQRYSEAFANVAGIRLFTEPSFARSNYWLNVLLLDQPDLELRNALIEATNRSGIMTRPVWRLLHTLPMFEACPRMDLSIANDVERRLINIPSSSHLEISDGRP